MTDQGTANPLFRLCLSSLRVERLKGIYASSAPSRLSRRNNGLANLPLLSSMRTA